MELRTAVQTRVTLILFECRISHIALLNDDKDNQEALSMIVNGK